MDEDLVSPLFLWSDTGPLQIPGTINESRRARAILRSAEQERFVFRGNKGGATLLRIEQPAINRQLRQVTLPPDMNFSSKKPVKTPLTYLDFFRQGDTGDYSFGPSVDPETNKVRRLAAPNLSQNARYQGLKFNLGQALAEVPTGQFRGHGVSKSRRLMYTRGSDGAIGPTGLAQVRPEGTWQPRDARGRLGTARPNPSARLQQGLRDLAASNITRAALPVIIRQFNVHPALKAAVNIEDMFKQITGISPTKTVLQEAKKQLTNTLNKAPTLNFGPLLPF